MSRPKRFLFASLLVGALAIMTAVLVAASLRRPDVPTYAPTPSEPREVGATRVGPVTYTVDTSSPDRWRFFSFSEGSVVENPGPLGWDLAFRRFNVIANGGPGFAGAGGVADLGRVDFDSASVAPEAGYQTTEARRDSLNAAVRRWYSYGFATHLLTPRPHVYAVRTADGRYAKLEFLSYYCPGALPGCLTFRYVYQGAGGRELDAHRPSREDRPGGL